MRLIIDFYFSKSENRIEISTNDLKFIIFSPLDLKYFEHQRTAIVLLFTNRINLYEGRSRKYFILAKQ